MNAEQRRREHRHQMRHDGIHLRKSGNQQEETEKKKTKRNQNRKDTIQQQGQKKHQPRQKKHRFITVSHRQATANHPTERNMRCQQGENSTQQHPYPTPHPRITDIRKRTVFQQRKNQSQKQNQPHRKIYLIKHTDHRKAVVPMFGTQTKRIGHRISAKPFLIVFDFGKHIPQYNIISPTHAVLVKPAESFAHKKLLLPWCASRQRIHGTVPTYLSTSPLTRRSTTGLLTRQPDSPS